MKNVEDIYPLSPVQRDLFGRAEDPSALSKNNAQVHLEVTFSPEERALEKELDLWNQAWTRVLSRHAVLRTLFLWEDASNPLQVVRQQVTGSWAFQDLRGAPEIDRAGKVEELARMARQQSVDLSQPPLARGTWIAVGDRKIHLLFTYHPLILDRPSAARVLSELLVLHAGLAAGDEPDLPESRPFRDYVAWLGDQAPDTWRSFWRDHLRDVRRSTTLPGLRAGKKMGSRREQHSVVLPAALGEELVELAGGDAEALANVVAAAWTLLLRRRTASDPLFAIHTAVQPEVWTDPPVNVGPYTSAVALCPTISRGMVIPDLLKSLAEEREEARRNAHLPLSEILEELPLSVLALPSPPIASVTGVKIRQVRWHHAIPNAALVLELPRAPMAHLDLEFDPQCLGIEWVEELGAELRGLLAALLSGRPSLGSLLETDGSATVIQGLDLATIEGLLERHRAVRASRVLLESNEAGVEEPVAYVLPDAPNEGERPIQFSLFYFADADSGQDEDKYRLYMDNARYADRNGFTAVWTPERHFHENGGLYPNPSVLSAGLATVTEQIGLRSGSVVLPLHHTLRVAEEWSIVDNLSGGRVGLSFASGWVPNDFAFFPDRFADKREHMFQQIDELQRLWRGEKIRARDGMGNDYEVGIFPRPIQPELPIWITCSGDPVVFERTAELRFKVLTALLTMPLEEAAEKIALYRNRLREVSGGKDSGHVSLMIHTYVGESEAATRDLVRPALSEFLGSHLGLVKSAKKSLQSDTHNDIPEEHLISFAFERYYRAASLLGTQEKCATMIERLRAVGVDELACLIDFGLDADTVLDGVRRLRELKDHFDGQVMDSHRGGPAVSDLQRYLAARLPEMAIPATIKWVDTLPEPQSAAVAAGTE